MINWTYKHNEIVTVPDQIGDTEDLLETYPLDVPLVALPTDAQRHHDEAGTVFALKDGRMAQLDGQAYGLWTGGTGNMVVRLTSGS